MGLVEFGEEGFDVSDGLGKVLAVVDLGVNFVTEDFVSSDVVTLTVLIDDVAHRIVVSLGLFVVLLIVLDLIHVKVNATS